MRFADEPAERVPTRQITRAAPDDPRRSFQAEKGDFDRALDELKSIYRDFVMGTAGLEPATSRV
jgi:hypothetical protein